MPSKDDSQAGSIRETRQLRRLTTIVDVVYAIIIWRAMMLLPRPTAEEFDQIGAFLSAHIGDLALVLIAILVAIIYWIQSNQLLGNLQTTDNRHSILIILQLFFLLVFLVSLRLGIELGASTGTRLFESIAALLVGIPGIWAWSYAKKDQQLLLPEVTEQYANRLSDRILAEPMTAAVTIPFAFIGPVLWEVSWLSYPLMVGLMRRWRRAQ